MKHVGDITALSGYNLPPVDVITGGSPCQDLSVAGKQAGLSGERSGLFLEQIRIVKEMREADRKRGRTDELIRPRFMVWENVHGAFSSNKGRDFQTVLNACVKIAEPDAPDVPYPEKGKWTKAGSLMGDGFSIAWRVIDAQYWGVPQRRRRIALVCDFGGFAAPEILFVRESLSGDSAEGGTPGKETSPGTGGGAYPAVARTLTAEHDGSFDPEGRGGNIVVQGFPLGFRPENTRLYDETATTVCNGTRPGFTCGVSQGAIPIHDKATRYQGGGPTRNGDGSGNGLGVGKDGDPCPTLSTADRHAVFDARGNGDGKTVNTLTGDHGNRVTDYTALVMAVHQNQCGEVRAGEVANTLSTNGNASGRNAPLIAIGLDSEYNAYPELYGTLKAHMSGGSSETVAVAVDCRDGTEAEVNGALQTNGNSLNANVTVRQASVVRRLTPLECERLQGYPSEKKADLSAMTKDEYIAWNISVGNIVVDAENGKVFAMRGPGGIALKEPKELKGSVVNGYRVVSIRNETTKLQCRVHRIVWISRNGVIPDGYCIDHINNDKQDNRLCNLQLLTPAENSTKAAKDGLYKTGEDNACTKLSPDLHDEIAFLYHCSDLTLKNLAEIYGVSKSRIHQIVREIGYTDIGDWTDDNGKTHKTSDAARYRALGNSIALPPWKWVLKRLSAQYERDALMGSLFDGIGGFPLLWEQINGKGSCVWASEIEPFCIAVTKRRLGED